MLNYNSLYSFDLPILTTEKNSKDNFVQIREVLPLLINNIKEFTEELNKSPSIYAANKDFNTFKDCVKRYLLSLKYFGSNLDVLNYHEYFQIYFHINQIFSSIKKTAKTHEQLVFYHLNRLSLDDKALAIFNDLILLHADQLKKLENYFAECIKKCSKKDQMQISLLDDKIKELNLGKQDELLNNKTKEIFSNKAELMFSESILNDTDAKQAFASLKIASTDNNDFKNSQPLKENSEMNYIDLMSKDIFNKVFSSFSIKELARLATLSKKWNAIISNYPIWLQEIAPITVKKIKNNPTDAKKIFMSTQQYIYKKMHSRYFSSSAGEIFKKAIIKGKIEVVYQLLNKKLVRVNNTIRYEKLGESCLYTLAPLALASMHNQYDVVKILLKFGADVDQISRETSGNEVTAWTPDDFSVLHYSDKKPNIKALLYLAKMEKAFMKENFIEAKNHFLASFENDRITVNDYVDEANKTFKGFNGEFLPERITAFNEWHLSCNSQLSQRLG